MEKEPIVSQREVQRKYEKLMHDVATSDYYKVDLTNRVNCYRCGCGHVTKTKDIDPGVTPMSINCESCNSSAYSSFYSDVAHFQKPTQEWYRPTLSECLKMRNKPAVLDHVLMGGLMKRPIKAD